MEACQFGISGGILMNQYNFEVYEKTLDNGLNCTIVHKPGFCQSFFMCATKAGGLDQVQFVDGDAIEHPSGCAHFLEHQMFRFQDQDITQRFAVNGATVNAFTTLDQTAYYFSTAQDPAPALSLLLDMVQTLDINEDSVEKEKKIILSEYDMYQQSPESRLMKMVWKALYHNHPIRIDVLGTRKDIETMTYTKLQRFYNCNYDPSHLYVIGVTGKDPKTYLDLILQKQVDRTSRVSSIQRSIAQEPEEVHETFSEDQMDISIPYAAYAIKLKPQPDTKARVWQEMCLQLSLQAIFSSLNPEYKNWLDQRILTTVSGAECDLGDSYGMIVFYSQTPQPELFFQLIDKLVKQLQEQPIDQSAFKALKHRLYATTIRTFDSMEDLAMEFLDARMQNYDVLQTIERIKELSISSVFETVQALDLSHSSKVLIHSKN